jgi:hypothetical protein
MANWPHCQNDGNAFLEGTVTSMKKETGSMNPEGESKLVNVYGDKFAKARPRPQVAFQRMISTKASDICLRYL